MQPDIFEVHYTDETGLQTIEVEGRTEAYKQAKALAKKTGRRTAVNKLPPRNWRVIYADCETGEATRIQTLVNGPEAICLFRKYNKRARRNQAVAIFWPSWAPELKITIERS